MITPHGFGTGPSLNQAERQSINSNQDQYNYRRQQMLNGQFIKMSVNRALTIGGLVSTVIHQ
jgi:hypothetical protein